MKTMNASKPRKFYYNLFCLLAAPAAAYPYIWGLASNFRFDELDAEEINLCIPQFLLAVCSTLLALLPLKPFYRSLYWLHRLLLIAVIGGTHAVVTALYITHFDNPWIWYLLWLIPPALSLLSHVIAVKMKRSAENGNVNMQHFLDYLLLLAPHPHHTRDAQKKAHPVRGILFGLLCTLAVFAVGGAVFLTGRFQNMGVQALSFTVKFSQDNGNPDLNLIIGLIAAALVLVCVFGCIIAIRRGRAASVTAKSLDRKTVRDIPMQKGVLSAWSIFVTLAFLGGLLRAADLLHVFHYMTYLTANDSFYETYYVSPENDLLTFPEKKKNLIFMFIESMENTFADYDSGGNYPVNYIPELLELEREGVNFSHCNLVGGASVFYDNVSYTMGSTVAHTSGVPLFSLRSLSPDTFTAALPGLRRLEDVLHDAGYTQFYMEGSSKKFACYDTYVGRYSDSVIYDSENARAEGYLTDENQSFWGLPDYALLEAAKDKLTMLSQSDKPFFFSMYTIDTHGVEGGYRCKYCDPAIENDYAASVRCASIHVAAFVRWIQQQDFYKDTVIVMVGDHTAEVVMDHDFIKPDHNSLYTRNTYNCILNSEVKPYKTKYRKYSANDMFPTTLAAIGVKIKGDRLGFGTNLFSYRPTLCEELDTEEYLDKITVAPDYYYKHFWNAQP